MTIERGDQPLNPMDSPFGWPPCGIVPKSLNYASNEERKMKTKTKFDSAINGIMQSILNKEQNIMVDFGAKLRKKK